MVYVGVCFLCVFLVLLFVGVRSVVLAFPDNLPVLYENLLGYVSNICSCENA